MTSREGQYTVVGVGDGRMVPDGMEELLEVVVVEEVRVRGQDAFRGEVLVSEPLPDVVLGRCC